MDISTYFNVILTWAWSCLLGELPKIGLIAVVITMAFALFVFTFGLKIFGKERITIHAWRGFLYQRIRSDVERLYRDIIVLKQHLELDNMYEVCYYKPLMKEGYKEKLDLLMKELICLEDNFYGSSEESDEDMSGPIEFQKIEWKGQPFRRVMMGDDNEPRLLRWYNECVRDFYTWIQSTEFSESELRESIIGLYKNSKIVKDNIIDVGDRRFAEPKESGGSLIFYYEGPPVYIEHCEMQPLQTADMVGIVMTGTQKSQAPGTPGSTVSGIQKSHASGTPESTSSETQNLHAPGKPKSTRSETQKSQLLGELESTSSEKHKFHALGKLEITSNDTQKSHAPGKPKSISRDTQKSHAPGKPKSISRDTQKSHTLGKPKSISSDTQKSHVPGTPESTNSDTQNLQTLDLLGNMINDIKKLQMPGMAHMLAMLRNEMALDMLVSVLTDRQKLQTVDMAHSVMSEIQKLDMAHSVMSEIQKLDMAHSVMSEIQKLDMPLQCGQ